MIFHVSKREKRTNKFKIIHSGSFEGCEIVQAVCGGKIVKLNSQNRIQLVK